METSQKLSSISIVLWSLIFFLYPFHNLELFKVPLYLYSALLFSISILVRLRNKIHIKTVEKPILFLGIFCIWTVAVNLYYLQELNALEFYSDMLRYGGILLFVTATFLAMQNQFETYFKYLAKSSFLAFIFILIVFFWQCKNERNPIFFDNINQLTRYSLLIATLIGLYYYGKSKEAINWIFAIILSLVNLIVLLSVSRAAILAIIVMNITLLAFKLRSTLLGICLGLISLFAYNFIQNSTEAYSEYVEYRFQENGKEDKLLNRGYTRFIDYPKYLLLGAGERRNDRFNDEYEFHSSYGSILWGYGIIGFMLLFMFHGFCFRFFDWTIILLVPLIINSIVHNDMRFIYTWILPILYFYKGKDLRQKGLQHVQLF